MALGSIDKVGLNVSCTTDCGKCCPRKAVINICCCKAEDSDDEKEFRKKAVKDVKSQSSSTLDTKNIKLDKTCNHIPIDSPIS